MLEVALWFLILSYSFIAGWIFIRSERQMPAKAIVSALWLPLLVYVFIKAIGSNKT